MKKPIIGITVDYIDDYDPKKYSDYPWYALRQHYSEIVLKCGGLPILLPFESYKDDLSTVLDFVDGLIIPGGDLDVPPSMYDEEILYDTKPCYERCQHESVAIMEALERDMPVLGICHGMQLLNVLLGGSLYQNILEQIQGAIDHKQPVSRDHTYHDISIEKETLLAKLLDSSEIFAVNSNHRQSIKDLGKGLITSAVCTADGVVEAIESTKHSFVMGIEWHPELEASKPQDSLIFTGFVEAARKYHGKTSKSNK